MRDDGVRIMKREKGGRDKTMNERIIKLCIFMWLLLLLAIERGKNMHNIYVFS